MAERLRSLDNIENNRSLDLTERFNERLLDQFVRFEISPDLEILSETDKIIVDELIKASCFINDIFLLQKGPNVSEIATAIDSPDSKISAAAREYFRIMQGPWDQLDNDRPFIGSTPKPLGAGYYPADISKEDIESWITEHPDTKDDICSNYAVVRLNDNKGLTAVPYSIAYESLLSSATKHLRNAALLSDNVSLKRFLETRALAFENNDYFESDIAWMEIDSMIEPTIGPYEVYEDKLMGAKAAFEAFIAIKIPDESEKLERYKKRLPWLEDNLPIPDEHKNFNRSTESSIQIVDVVYAAGDANDGTKAIAFNLPNDKKVREIKGSKNVLMRNIIHAKYDRILRPIAKEVLSDEDNSNLSSEAFLQFILHHELSHGLGPSLIKVAGRETDTRNELKEYYSAVEEAKADVMSIYNILALIEKGDISSELRDSLDATYVAGLFRTIRFGAKNDHCLGVLCQFNYLSEKGALEFDNTGRYKTVSEKFPDTISDLLQKILMIEATGDYNGARAFLSEYSNPTPQILKAVDRLIHIPIDLDIVYKLGSNN